MRFSNTQKFLVGGIAIVVFVVGIWLIFWQNRQSAEELAGSNSPVSASPVTVSTSTPTPTSSGEPHPPAAAGMKLYRNEEWGFEFKYPDGWSFHEDTFRSPASKFNLVGASPGENNIPNPINPSVLVNIVTPDFSDNASVNMERLGAITENVVVNGINGVKYEYKVGVQKEILVVIPFRSYRMILGTIKGYEDVLNDVLSSFKFLE